MEILRAKTIDLRQTRELTPLRLENSALNEKEALAQKAVLQSAPRRLVLELTNRCNLNCVMCGRNAARFQPTVFNFDWLSYFEEIAEKAEEVTLMGWGEPTVHPKFPDFLKWAKERGLRKYFCTNGMRLDALFEAIFRYETDIIAVSLDGPDAETNAQIRRGADFAKITSALADITAYKAQNGLEYPYLNFVFTAMKQNLHQLPEMVRLAASLGLDEVKAVFLTAFDEASVADSLYFEMQRVADVFQEAQEEAQRLCISLKLPHLVGEDPAGEQMHKTCYTGWRDFFLGSDGYVRPCMSTAQKLFPISEYASFWEGWNSEEYQEHRQRVNQSGMVTSCKNCYQSSFANWNKKESFIQTGNTFSPEWQE